MISNNYTMVCPPVCGHNLFYMGDNSCIILIPTTSYISVDLAHYEIVRSKVGKGYIIVSIACWVLFACFFVVS